MFRKGVLGIADAVAGDRRTGRNGHWAIRHAVLQLIGIADPARQGNSKPRYTSCRRDRAIRQPSTLVCRETGRRSANIGSRVFPADRFRFGDPAGAPTLPLGLVPRSVGGPSGLLVLGSLRSELVISLTAFRAPNGWGEQLVRLRLFVSGCARAVWIAGYYVGTGEG
jgi:hypothetical protein